ncbi:MAG: YceH family protein [Gemmataceae bacterium]
MLPDAQNVSASDPPSWPVLSLAQRRVLGVLVEKAKTTPDAYPLSLNALVTGSNQKSNRDPPLNLSDIEVEDALATLQKQLLVSRISGGRVERWRHLLYEAWKSDKVELAILGELLLRGPQTEGELRGRASRMEPIEDLDTLRAILKRLAERKLVVYLTPEGRRGTVLTHGFHEPSEIPHLRKLHGAAATATEFAASQPHSQTAPAASPPPRQNAGHSEPGTPLAERPTELDELRSEVASLKDQIQKLADEFHHMKRSLGE